MNEYEIEDIRLEESRDRDHKKKIKIPDKIVIFSVNDMWWDKMKYEKHKIEVHVSKHDIMLLESGSQVHWSVRLNNKLYQIVASGETKWLNVILPQNI